MARVFVDVMLTMWLKTWKIQVHLRWTENRALVVQQLDRKTVKGENRVQYRWQVMFIY